jgi:hypothetical protein
MQYAPLEGNAWDSRLLMSLLHKHLHRGVLNARSEVLPAHTATLSTIYLSIYIYRYVNLILGAGAARAVVSGAARTCRHAHAVGHQEHARQQPKRPP